MPPQPLSRVKGDAEIIFGAATMVEKRIPLAASVMSVIGAWSSNDLILARLTSTFLKADFEIVAAMMQALTGGEGRRSAIGAAAEAALDADNYKLFQAVQKANRPSRNRRNDFCHHVWAISDQLPDAVLLIDPKHMTMLSAQRYATIAEVYKNPSRASDLEALPEVDPKNVFVYRVTDLGQEEDAALKASIRLLALEMALQPARKPIVDAEIREKGRQVLFDDPQIQQALEEMSREDTK